MKTNHSIALAAVLLLSLAAEPARAFFWQKEKRQIQVETAPVTETKIPKTKDSTRRFNVRFNVLVKAPLSEVRSKVLNYSIYKQANPYLERVEYDEPQRILLLEGGIWKFKLGTSLRIEEKTQRWLRYTVLSGYSEGLNGDLRLEPSSEPQGTWLRFEGDFRAYAPVPVFLIRRATNLLIELTANKVADWMEK